MVKLLLNIKVVKKYLYDIGKIGFALSLILFAVMILTNLIDKKDDLKSYYNFWQYLLPMAVEGETSDDRLSFF